jgi:hypothetical protein
MESNSPNIPPFLASPRSTPFLDSLVFIMICIKWLGYLYVHQHLEILP